MQPASWAKVICAAMSFMLAPVASAQGWYVPFDFQVLGSAQFASPLEDEGLFRAQQTHVGAAAAVIETMDLHELIVTSIGRDNSPNHAYAGGIDIESKDLTHLQRHYEALVISKTLGPNHRVLVEEAGAKKGLLSIYIDGERTSLVPKRRIETTHTHIDCHRMPLPDVPLFFELGVGRIPRIVLPTDEELNALARLAPWDPAALPFQVHPSELVLHLDPELEEAMAGGLQRWLAGNALESLEELPTFLRPISESWRKAFAQAISAVGQQNGNPYQSASWPQTAAYQAGFEAGRAQAVEASSGGAGPTPGTGPGTGPGSGPAHNEYAHLEAAEHNAGNNAGATGEQDGGASEEEGETGGGDTNEPNEQEEITITGDWSPPESGDED